ncbi:MULTISPECIES: pilus assembly protein [unclassified Thioalkalivibrio]|uniref:pilus assembly protein n=1 Tax=unclassified Thioalkalivibrio TaxID=2621013 RepID=UPI0003703707|nr:MULTISPECIES: PilC/PilY family type IV pilus protein [unclassified Thioalkalivibrio]
MSDKVKAKGLHVRKGAAFKRKTLAYTVTLAAFSVPALGTASEISQVPLFLTQSVPPQAMLSLSNDHQLYFEAYPDYADLTGDGRAEAGYNHDVDYYGYFDSYKCYTHSGGVFDPRSETDDKYCSGSQWSGNFLNYVSMARIDVVRKILYGGYRSTDTSSETILERTYLPNDVHSWVRHYDGDDLDRLTPYDLPEESTARLDQSITIPSGSRDGGGDRIWIDPNWSGAAPEMGDQIRMTDRDNSGREMLGVVRGFGWNGAEIQVTHSTGEGQTGESWDVINHSRRGVSFCNTTATSSTLSQNVTDPPLIRVAEGDYSMWAANERWQCQWFEEESYTGHSEMEIGGRAFSNGNPMGDSGLTANAGNPRNSVRKDELSVRVSACVDGLVGGEDCEMYPDGNLKPVGLLQEYGAEDEIEFGLMSGTYARNRSGGALRKPVGSMADEIRFDTDGTFTRPADSGGIIETLDGFRIYGYRHDDGTYFGRWGSDDCQWGLGSFNDGQCTNWGNPQSEMYLETLRYFAGLEPTPAFLPNGSTDFMDLPVESDWEDPLTDETWCTSINVIQFNSSVSSYDSERLGGFSDLSVGSLGIWTDAVGSGEGIHGAEWFVGEVGSNDDQLCTPKTINNLSDARGVCPEAPRLGGSYHIAGLAHFAHTDTLRTDLQDAAGETADVQAETYGVALAPAVPRIEIPRPGETDSAVILQPACRNDSVGGECAIADFAVVEQDLDEGTGSFFVQWEDSEQGGDFDMDANGVLSYEIDGNSIRITSNVFSQSTPNEMGFGFVVQGTTRDGFHVYSGINGFSRSGQAGVPSCSGCSQDDPPVSHEFQLTGATDVGTLEEPLWYASKWGGFTKARRDSDPQFPNDPETWDADGDGVPDNYFFAIDPSELAENLAEVFETVQRTGGAATSVAESSTELAPEGQTLVYQAQLDSEDWSGDLVAYEIDPFTLDFDQQWSAAEQMPDHFQRNLITRNIDSGTGAAFQWGGALQEDVLNDLGYTQELMDYLRGDQSLERQEGGDFRDRSRLIGDIVNSNPAFQGHRTNFGFSGSDYQQFRADNRDYVEAVYVGTNAGMVHAFDGNTGEELFAYIPGMLLEHLPELAEPDYEHRFFVDGQQTIAHAQDEDGDWMTVLVGTLGGGGRGVYALDVTDPESVGPDSVLWEISGDDYDRLGHIFGGVTVGRLESDGDFYALFGNGYLSNDGTASLFAVELATGDVDVIELNGAADNGMSEPVFRADSSRNLFEAYAGDLHGNMWKMDNLRVQGNVRVDEELLFVAEDPDEGDRQPITSKPAVGRHPDGGAMVFFGTGQFFLEGDNIVEDDDQVQSVYGVRSEAPDVAQGPSPSKPFGRNNLLQQEFVGEGEIEGFSVRVTTQNDELDEDHAGWYLDLDPATYANRGERVIEQPILLDGRVEFVTMTPLPDPCSGGGTSSLFALDARTGSRVDAPVFDLDGTGSFGDGDMIEIDGELVPPSAVDPGLGIMGQPTVIDDPETGTRVRVLSGTGGVGEESATVDDIRAPGDPADTSRSWRQLR